MTINGSPWTCGLGSEKNPPYRDHILPNAIAVVGVAGMKFRGADRPVLVKGREIFLQGLQCKRIARIASRCFSTEAFDCRLWSIHESCHSEQDVISVLRQPPSRRPAE